MPSKWAILIGIDFYVNRSMCLEGAVNDVDDIQLYLSRYHTLASITTLRAIDDHSNKAQVEPAGPESSWPTYENIVLELQRVKKVASPGDFVYLHYSGHGTLSPTTATEYQENFGSDAALVLFDRESGVRYLRGIELAALLNELAQKEIKLTVVLDCCHSGAVSRSDQRIGRGVRWDDDVASAHPVHWPQPSTLSTSAHRDASTSQHWLLRPQGYTLMAACGPGEIAFECEGKDGRKHGALTYFLFQALTTASTNLVDIGLGALYGRICAQLHVPLPQQHPMLLGNAASIFLQAEDQTDRSVLRANVTNILGSGRIWLNVGRAQMVSLGDEYEICLMESKTMGSTKTSIKYTIKAVHALYSEAELSDPAQNGVNVAKGCSARLSKPFRTKAQIALLHGVEAELERMVDESPWLELVDTIGMSASSPAFHLRLTEQGKYAIYIGGTEEVRNIPAMMNSDPGATRQVVSVLEHLAKFAAIEGLENKMLGSMIQYNSNLGSTSKNSPSQSPQLEFSIIVESKNDPSKAMIGNTFSVSDGEKIKFTMKNHTSHSFYLTVLDMTPLRQISKLYPSSDRGYYKEVRPQDVQFRGQVSFTVQMSIPDRLKREIETRIEDVLKFFITTRPTSTLLYALELPELPLGKSMSERSQDLDQSLLEFLENPSVMSESGGSWRVDTPGGNARWTCQNFIIQTKAIRSGGAET